MAAADRAGRAARLGAGRREEGAAGGGVPGPGGGGDARAGGGSQEIRAPASNQKPVDSCPSSASRSFAIPRRMQAASYI
jgi:hypothetical protein